MKQISEGHNIAELIDESGNRLSWEELDTCRCEVYENEFVLGDLIRRAFLKHGKDSWVSIAREIIIEIKKDERGG